jgi:ribonuclease-3 family protein
MLPSTPISPDLYSPLALAYLGDAVHELLIRTSVVAEGNRSVNKLSKNGVKQARAAAQSDLYKRLVDVLTDEELAILKRGRNAKSLSRAKNAAVSDYRRATGVETLFGYLYLKGDYGRLVTLYNISQTEVPQ